jgi:hypothetical protein
MVYSPLAVWGEKETRDPDRSSKRGHLMEAGLEPRFGSVSVLWQAMLLEGPCGRVNGKSVVKQSVNTYSKSEPSWGMFACEPRSSEVGKECGVLYQVKLWQYNATCVIRAHVG